MKITLTTNLDLTIFESPYPIIFAWNKKRGINDNTWFTPQGTCKIFIGGLRNINCGTLNKKDYDYFVSEMKKNKCDILTDGRDYYTIAGSTNNYPIVQITNMGELFMSANKEFEQRKESFLEYY
jgi:hypothetical protein